MQMSSPPTLELIYLRSNDDNKNITLIPYFAAHNRYTFIVRARNSLNAAAAAAFFSKGEHSIFFSFFRSSPFERRSHPHLTPVHGWFRKRGSHFGPLAPSVLLSHLCNLALERKKEKLSLFVRIYVMIVQAGGWSTAPLFPLLWCCWIFNIFDERYGSGLILSLWSAGFLSRSHIQKNRPTPIPLFCVRRESAGVYYGRAR